MLGENLSTNQNMRENSNTASGPSDSTFRSQKTQSDLYYDKFGGQLGYESLHTALDEIFSVCSAITDERVSGGIFYGMGKTMQAPLKFYEQSAKNPDAGYMEIMLGSLGEIVAGELLPGGRVVKACSLYATHVDAHGGLDKYLEPLYLQQNENFRTAFSGESDFAERMDANDSINQMIAIKAAAYYVGKLGNTTVEAAGDLFAGRMWADIRAYGSKAKSRLCEYADNWIKSSSEAATSLSGSANTNAEQTLTEAPNIADSSSSSSSSSHSAIIPPTTPPRRDIPINIGVRIDPSDSISIGVIFEIGLGTISSVNIVLGVGVLAVVAGCQRFYQYQQDRRARAAQGIQEKINTKSQELNQVYDKLRALERNPILFREDAESLIQSMRNLHTKVEELKNLYGNLSQRNSVFSKHDQNEIRQMGKKLKQLSVDLTKEIAQKDASLTSYPSRNEISLDTTLQERFIANGFIQLVSEIDTLASLRNTFALIINTDLLNNAPKNEEIINEFQGITKMLSLLFEDFTQQLGKLESLNLNSEDAKKLKFLINRGLSQKDNHGYYENAFLIDDEKYRVLIDRFNNSKQFEHFEAAALMRFYLFSMQDPDNSFASDAPRFFSKLLNDLSLSELNRDMQENALFKSTMIAILLNSKLMDEVQVSSQTIQNLKVRFFSLEDEGLQQPTKLLLAHFLLRTSLEDDLTSIIGACRELDPMNLHWDTIYIAKLIQQESWTEVAVGVTRALEKAPDNILLKLMLAESQLKCQQPDEALKTLNSIDSVEKQYEKGFFELAAHVHQDLGQTELYEQFILKLQQLEQSAVAMQTMGMQLGTNQEMRTSVSQEGPIAKMRMQTWLADLQASSSIDNFISYFKSPLFDPNLSKETLFSIADALQHNKHWESSRLFLIELERIDPNNADTQWLLAKNYIALNDFEQAKYHINRGLEIDNHCIEALSLEKVLSYHSNRGKMFFLELLLYSTKLAEEIFSRQMPSKEFRSVQDNKANCDIGLLSDLIQLTGRLGIKSLKMSNASLFAQVGETNAADLISDLKHLSEFDKRLFDLPTTTLLISASIDVFTQKFDSPVLESANSALRNTASAASSIEAIYALRSNVSVLNIFNAFFALNRLFSLVLFAQQKLSPKLYHQFCENPLGELATVIHQAINEECYVKRAIEIAAILSQFPDATQILLRQIPVKAVVGTVSRIPGVNQLLSALSHPLVTKGLPVAAGGYLSYKVGKTIWDYYSLKSEVKASLEKINGDLQNQRFVQAREKFEKLHKEGKISEDALKKEMAKIDFYEAVKAKKYREAQKKLKKAYDLGALEQDEFAKNKVAVEIQRLSDTKKHAELLKLIETQTAFLSVELEALKEFTLFKSYCAKDNIPKARTQLQRLIDANYLKAEDPSTNEMRFYFDTLQLIRDKNFNAAHELWQSMKGKNFLNTQTDNGLYLENFIRLQLDDPHQTMKVFDVCDGQIRELELKATDAQAWRINCFFKAYEILKAKYLDRTQKAQSTLELSILETLGLGQNLRAINTFSQALAHRRLEDLQNTLDRFLEGDEGQQVIFETKTAIAAVEEEIKGHREFMHLNGRLNALRDYVNTSKETHQFLPILDELESALSSTNYVNAIKAANELLNTPEQVKALKAIEIDSNTTVHTRVIQLHNQLGMYQWAGQFFLFDMALRFAMNAPFPGKTGMVYHMTNLVQDFVLNHFQALVTDLSQASFIDQSIFHGDNPWHGIQLITNIRSIRDLASDKHMLVYRKALQSMSKTFEKYSANEWFALTRGVLNVLASSEFIEAQLSKISPNAHNAAFRAPISMINLYFLGNNIYHYLYSPGFSITGKTIYALNIAYLSSFVLSSILMLETRYDTRDPHFQRRAEGFLIAEAVARGIAENRLLTITSWLLSFEEIANRWPLMQMLYSYFPETQEPVIFMLSMARYLPASIAGLVVTEIVKKLGLGIVNEIVQKSILSQTGVVFLPHVGSAILLATTAYSAFQVYKSISLANQLDQVENKIHLGELAMADEFFRKLKHPGETSEHFDRYFFFQSYLSIYYQRVLEIAFKEIMQYMKSATQKPKSVQVLSPVAYLAMDAVVGRAAGLFGFYPQNDAFSLQDWIRRDKKFNDIEGTILKGSIQFTLFDDLVGADKLLSSVATENIPEAIKTKAMQLRNNINFAYQRRHQFFFDIGTLLLREYLAHFIFKNPSRIYVKPMPALASMVREIAMMHFMVQSTQGAFSSELFTDPNQSLLGVKLPEFIFGVNKIDPGFFWRLSNIFINMLENCYKIPGVDILQVGLEGKFWCEAMGLFTHSTLANGLLPTLASPHLYYLTVHSTSLSSRVMPPIIRRLQNRFEAFPQSRSITFYEELMQYVRASWVLNIMPYYMISRNLQMSYPDWQVILRQVSWLRPSLLGIDELFNTYLFPLSTSAINQLSIWVMPNLENMQNTTFYETATSNIISAVNFIVTKTKSVTHTESILNCFLQLFILAYILALFLRIFMRANTTHHVRSILTQSDSLMKRNQNLEAVNLLQTINRTRYFHNAEEWRQYRFFYNQAQIGLPRCEALTIYNDILEILDHITLEQNKAFRINCLALLVQAGLMCYKEGTVLEALNRLKRVEDALVELRDNVDENPNLDIGVREKDRIKRSQKFDKLILNGVYHAYFDLIKEQKHFDIEAIKRIHEIVTGYFNAKYYRSIRYSAYRIDSLLTLLLLENDPDNLAYRNRIQSHINMMQSLANTKVIKSKDKGEKIKFQYNKDAINESTKDTYLAQAEMFNKILISIEQVRNEQVRQKSARPRDNSSENRSAQSTISPVQQTYASVSSSGSPRAYGSSSSSSSQTCASASSSSVPQRTGSDEEGVTSKIRCVTGRVNFFEDLARTSTPPVEKKSSSSRARGSSSSLSK